MNQDMGVISKGKCVVDLLRLYISWGGKTQWCLSTKYPIIEEDGRIIGLIGISRRLPRPDQNNLNYKRLNDFIKTVDGNCGEKVLISDRSEEHTSELQSLMRISYAVFCLKKKKIKHKRPYTRHIHIRERRTK